MPTYESRTSYESRERCEVVNVSDKGSNEPFKEVDRFTRMTRPSISRTYEESTRRIKSGQNSNLRSEQACLIKRCLHRAQSDERSADAETISNSTYVRG